MTNLQRNYFGTFMTVFTSILPLLVNCSDKVLQSLRCCREFLVVGALPEACRCLLEAEFLDFLSAGSLITLLAWRRPFQQEAFALRMTILIPLLLNAILHCADLLDKLHGLLKALLSNHLKNHPSHTLAALFKVCFLSLGPLCCFLHTPLSTKATAALIFHPFMLPVKGFESNWPGALMTVLTIILPALIPPFHLKSFDWLACVQYSVEHGKQVSKVNAQVIMLASLSLALSCALLAFFLHQSINPRLAAQNRPFFAALLLLLTPLIYGWFCEAVGVAVEETVIGLPGWSGLGMGGVGYVAYCWRPESVIGRFFRPFLAESESGELDSRGSTVSRDSNDSGGSNMSNITRNVNISSAPCNEPMDNNTTTEHIV